MIIQCPHCGFSKDIDPAQLPTGVTRVNCPKCKQSFPLAQPQPEPQPAAMPLQQQARQQAVPNPTPQEQSQLDVDALPKAGFWMRVVATFIDAFIVFIIEFLLGSLLAYIGLSILGNTATAGGITMIVQLFGFAISFSYYVFFTGYCGQTPGKMALRIKVICRDGSPIGFGRAALREIPAKFISGILFGIGYLMVAFDDQKQGLHDRMVNTYVIKL